VMHARLAKVDPAAALAILPGNLRRVVRALEVIELTGAPFTATLPRDGESRYPEAIQIGLKIERSILSKRIDLRVDQMWAAGLVGEVKQLSFLGLREGKTSRRALGYLQILRALDGNTSLETARVETKAATRKYARRQISWFRRDNRISWVEPENAVEQAISMLSKSYRSDGRIIK
jgi:tRNA dimethylallyltransferase